MDYGKKFAIARNLTDLNKMMMESVEMVVNSPLSTTIKTGKIMNIVWAYDKRLEEWADEMDRKRDTGTVSG